MALRYVCLSDLHLGSPEGLLCTDEQVGRAGSTPTAALLALGEGLRATIRAMLKPGDPLPTLVLMGDIMELGLASYGVASDALSHLFQVLFPETEAACFDTKVVYVPGNHDHHLWRMAQDRAYLDVLRTRPPGSRARSDIPVDTPLLGAPPYPCEIVTSVLQAVPGCAEFECHIAYPNWGVANADKSRAVVFHHGHFIDTMYLALSQFRGWMVGRDSLPATVGELERNNGAWIDFLWSDLGSSGNIAEGAETLYEVMMDGAASHRFAQTVAQRAAKSFSALAGTSAAAPLALGGQNLGLTPGKLISAAVDIGLGRFAEGQREAWRDVMSDSEVDTLRWYVAGPVANQFLAPAAEDDDTLRSDLDSAHKGNPAGQPKLPDRLTFIFGHTHKPFQDALPVKPYALPVQVFNTGGWEFRGSAPMPCHGGSAVLVDDDLNVVALRLYNDPVHKVVPPVSVEGTGYDNELTNPLIADAREAVKAAQQEWAVFTRDIEASIRASIHQRVSAQVPAEEYRNNSAEVRA